MLLCHGLMEEEGREDIYAFDQRKKNEEPKRKEQMVMQYITLYLFFLFR